MKKLGFIALPFVCAVGCAMADDIGGEDVTTQAAVSAPDKSPVQHRAIRHRMLRMPTGDLRHCLDLKTSTEIIRCAETRRKR